MPVKNIYDTIRQVIQDAVAPQLREITGELKLLHTEIKRLDEKIDFGLKRLDEKIDSVKEDVRNLREEFKLAIDIHERLAAVEAKLSH